MASDLFVFDGSYYNYQHNSSSELVSSDCNNLLFNDPFLDPSINHFHGGLDGIDPVYNSPPIQQLENLSLYQTQFQTLPSDFENACGNFNALDVKTEEAQVGFENYMQFMPHSYDNSEENVAKFMQRTCRSNSFDVVYNNNNNYGGSGFDVNQTQIGNVTDSSKFQLNSPENRFLAGQLRRVCSAGDIDKSRVEYTRQKSFSSPLATESGGFTEDGNLKAGRYSAEERKERISKYRAKRSQRNFTKTIKYACRKTLADSRPRIRGRFARNDEYVETPNSKPASSREEDEDDDLWLEGLLEKEEIATASNMNFVNNYGESQQFSHCDFLFDREF